MNKTITVKEFLKIVDKIMGSSDLGAAHLVVLYENEDNSVGYTDQEPTDNVSFHYYPTDPGISLSLWLKWSKIKIKLSNIHDIKIIDNTTFEFKASKNDSLYAGNKFLLRIKKVTWQPVI
jgi:hypothetical protein